MAGAYQRNVTNPNSGKRSASRLPNRGSSVKASPCISTFRDKPGKTFLFEPKAKARKQRKVVIVVKDTPITKRSQFTMGATYGESWQGGK
jgi:hypothetical protein